MTTIAYKDGVMASDSQGTYGDLRVPGATQKLFRMTDGSIAGVCGSEGVWRRLLAWIDTDRSEPMPPSESGDSRGVVVLMKPSGEIEVFEDGFSYIEFSEFMAYGSGQAVALGALHAGASAEEAVRIATLVDTRSGGAVQVMKRESD